MRKVTVTVIAVVLAAAALAFLFRASIAVRVMQASVLRGLTTNVVTAWPDGLHVALCGSGSPLPDAERAGPCVAVVAGQSVYVVDAGSGGPRNLRRMGLPIGALKGVFMTHYHSDHLDGLGELGMQRWVGAANTQPLPVYGPAGVEAVVTGFNQAYALDAGYRTAHHGPDVAPPAGAGLEAHVVELPADGVAVVALEEGGLRVSAFVVDHRPVVPAVGYRFDYGGRSLVISGDTAKSTAVADHAKGVDLLVHEALAPKLVALMAGAAQQAGAERVEKIMKDIPDYHTSPVEAAETAASAGVTALLYYHIVPPLPLPGLDVIFLEGVGDVFAGETVLGRDGTLVSLPSGSEEVVFSNLL